MWQNKKSKREWLPIERREWGYEQRSSFNHPDLWHESVIEPESPFVLGESQPRGESTTGSTSGSTERRTIIVMGDQNAGKSTLLHSFSYHADARFLHLSSELSVLSSSFLNSRILPQDELAQSPIDELPFIDTDVARATILMNTEDFQFFLDRPATPGAPTYTCLEFIELGGDHLDRLASKTRTNDASLSAILDQSERMIQTASKVVYFINGNADSDDELMLARLRYINTCFSKDVLLFVSRGDLNASQQLCRHYDDLLSSYQWNFRISASAPVRVLRPDGTLNDKGIVDFVRYLFSNEASQVVSLGPLISKTLLECWKAAMAEDSATIDLYVTAESLRRYCIEAEGDIPETSVLQMFPNCATTLVEHGVVLARQSSLCLRLADKHWTRPKSETPLAIRFPVYAPLVRCLAEPFVYWGCAPDVPLEVVKGLEAEICEAWHSGNLEVFVLLVEDWSLCGQGDHFPCPLGQSSIDFPEVETSIADSDHDKVITFE